MNDEPFQVETMTIDDDYSEQGSNSDGFETCSEFDDDLDLEYTNDSNDEAEDDDDEPVDGTAFITYRLQSLVNDSADPAAMVENDMEMIMEIDESIERWNHGVHNSFPFNDMATMVLHTLVNGDDKVISRTTMKKIHYAICVLLKLQKSYGDSGRQFNMPSINAIFNYKQHNVNDIPEFKTSEMVIETSTKNGTIEHRVPMNLPSKHIELLVADPIRSAQTSTLPDHTPNQLLGPQQGEKWKTHPLFQQPQLTIDGEDYWTGDRITTTEGCGYFLIRSFIMINARQMASGHFYVFSDGWTKFYNILDNIDVCKITGHANEPLDLARSCSITNDGTSLPLTTDHQTLAFTTPTTKKPIIDRTNNAIIGHYPVKITPIILFTDDTSGNISKQYNKYDSWSMTFAAMPFSMRNKRENTFFISAVSGSAGLHAMHLVPGLVEDLLQLEQGVVMYSFEHGKKVLVIAPILFIAADNPRHAELCGIKMATVTFPC